MPAYGWDDLPSLLDEPAIGEGRAVEAGGMMVQRERWKAGADATEVFKGLPGDACQSPHWGHILDGAMKVKTKAGVDEYRAGQSYYLEPGHVPFFEVVCELVEFSPAEEYARTMEHADRRMQELMGAAG